MEGKMIYNLISDSIWQCGFIKDKNKIRQKAKTDMLRLIACSFIGKFKGNATFNEKEFLQACGLEQYLYPLPLSSTAWG